MIATHNINVNGKWYRTGEYYSDPAPEQVEMEAVAEPEPEPEAEKPAESAPKKTATRRKTAK